MRLFNFPSPFRFQRQREKKREEKHMENNNNNNNSTNHNNVNHHKHTSGKLASNEYPGMFGHGRGFGAQLLRCSFLLLSLSFCSSLLSFGSF